MVTQGPPKRLIIRWTTLKGLAALLLFLIVTVLAEYIIVLYAIALGVTDTAVLQWGFRFPATDWVITLAISPLFHLIPVAVVITLLSSWTYLTKHLAVKPSQETRKAGTAFKRGQESRLNQTKKFFGRIKSGLLRAKGVSYLWQKIHFARATVKSALIVLLVFSVLILVVSLLTYPRLIYETLSNLYQNSPSALNFVRDTGQGLASLGSVFLPIYNALVSIAPSFKGFALAVGGVIRPLVGLDNVGKYLFFQNAAAWLSALAVLMYGEYTRRSFRYRKSRRS